VLKFTPSCLLLGRHWRNELLDFSVSIHRVSLRFSGNRLGVWTLTKESNFAGESYNGHGAKGLRRNGKDAKRPSSTDTTTTDLDATMEVEKSNMVREDPDFPVSMNLLADAFKNRFA
jgi:hypothetical protein